jgi:hypothetical protein
LVSKNSCCSFVFFGLFLLYVFFITVPQIDRDYMVQCVRALLPTQSFVKLGSPGAHNSPFMSSNLLLQMLLKSLARLFTP